MSGKYVPYIVLLWAVLAIAPLRAESAQEPPLNTGYSGGEVIVAVPRYYPPYFLSNPDGTPRGFAIETMDAIADNAGIDIKYKSYKHWSRVFFTIKTGEAHVIPFVDATPERAQFLNFTTALERFPISMFVLQERFREYAHGLPDGSVVATTHTSAVRNQLSKQGVYVIKTFDGAAQAIDAILHGQVDAVALEEPVVEEHLRILNIPQRLVPTNKQVALGTHAIAIARTHHGLFEQLARTTAQFVKSKEYEEIYRKWHSGEPQPWSVETLAYLVLALMGTSVLAIWLWYFIKSKFTTHGSVDALLRASPTEINLRRRVMMLASVMLGSIAVSVFSVLYLHYLNTLEQTKHTLQDTVTSQAAMIESFAALSPETRRHRQDTNIHDEVIARIQSINTRYTGLGEITIAEKSGNHIHYILRQHHWDRLAPSRLPMSTKLAEPMRLALSGKSGTIIGPDYRNEPVLAAYDYIEALGLGIVLKMDISEIQAPHIRMAVYGSLIAFVIAMLSVVIYIRMIMPVIRDVQENEALYQGILDNAPLGIYVKNLDGRYRRANKKFCNDVGLSKAEIEGHLPHEIFSEQLAQTAQRSDQDIIDTSKPVSFETQYKAADGTERTIFNNKFPIENAQGELYALGGIGTDITELRHAQEALIASEQRFRATFEQAAVGIAHVGLDGAWLRVNNVLCEITGYSRAELLNLSFQDISHPDDLDADLQNVSKLLAGEIETYSMEKRYIRKDGAPTWINLTGSVVRNPTGAPQYFIAVIADINDKVLVRSEANSQRDHFRRYLDLAGTMIIALDHDGNITLINDYASEVMGYEHDELLGHNWFDIAIPSDVLEDVKIVAKKILSGQIEEVAYYENEILTKEGERRLIAWNNTYLHDTDGTIHTLLSSGVDITETRTALAELERTNRALRTISSCNEVLVRSTREEQLLKDVCRVVVEEGHYKLAWVSFIRNTDDGKKFVPTMRYGVGQDAVDKCMTALNQDNMYTENRPTVFQDVIEQICPPNNDGYCKNHGLNALCALPLMEEGSPFGGLFIASENPTSFDASAIKLLTELANDLSYGLLSLRRERERRQALEELRLSEERSSTIINSAHDAIISVDDHGLITQFNPAAQDMFGITFDNAIGQPIEDTVIPERFREAHAKSFRTYIKSGKSKLFGKSIDLYGLKSDGSEFPVELILSAMPGNTEDVCTAVIRDVSDRYEADRHRRQAQNMESLGNLAGGMAHDINNMLLPILNLTSMVRRTLDDQSGEYKKLGMVEQAAERVKELVQSILAFSRQDVPVFEDQDIEELVAKTLNLIRSTTSKSITIEEKLEKCDGTVNVDEGQFTAALINLASNAEDAMEGRVGQIEIKLKRMKPSSRQMTRNSQFRAIEYAKVSVIDDGHGMAADVLERAMDPFFTTKPPGKGTGLGMSMVHGIITKHGGVMEVSSTPGEGTRVDLYLPLKRIKKKTGSNNEPHREKETA